MRALARSRHGAVDRFGLQAGEERRRQSVFQKRARDRHQPADAVAGVEPLEGTPAVSRAAIDTHDDALNLAVPRGDRRLQRVTGQRGLAVPCNRIDDQSAAVEVDHACQIEPPLPGGDLRDTGADGRVGGLLVKVEPQEVGKALAFSFGRVSERLSLRRLAPNARRGMRFATVFTDRWDHSSRSESSARTRGEPDSPSFALKTSLICRSSRSRRRSAGVGSPTACSSNHDCDAENAPSAVASRTWWGSSGA